MDSNNLAQNINDVLERIAAACARAGRNPAEVQLLAASKSRLPEEVDEAARLGVRLFGENKVQEARAKIPLCSARVEWHFIGHLQKNKVRDAVRLFDMIHSVDSAELARLLDEEAAEQGRRVRVLLQVNVAGESSKFGLRPADVRETAAVVNELPRLELCGLMTMAPYCEDPERARPWFRQLRELRDALERDLGVRLPELSMGMSGDLEPAVEEGATIVRVGTALFGPRRSRIAREANSAAE